MTWRRSVDRIWRRSARCFFLFLTCSSSITTGSCSSLLSTFSRLTFDDYALRIATFDPKCTRRRSTEREAGASITFARRSVIRLRVRSIKRINCLRLHRRVDEQECVFSPFWHGRRQRFRSDERERERQAVVALFGRDRTKAGVTLDRLGDANQHRGLLADAHRSTTSVRYQAPKRPN